MTTGFGLAAVTAVIKSRLEERLTAADVQAAIGPVLVTSLPPDQVQSGAAEPNQLNLYLHHATPSPAWRAEGHPMRSSTGSRIARTPLALDLQYLVTAFGVDTYAAEILLGMATAELHERPLLDSDSVDRVLHPTVPDASLPAAVAASGLEHQAETVRLTPVAFGSEEMSRLWTALGAQYRATAAYLVGPVLIDPLESAAPAMPVLQPPSITAERFAVLTIRDAVLAPADERRPHPSAPLTGTSLMLVRGEVVGGGSAQVLVGADALPVAARRVDGLVVDLAAATNLHPGPVAVQVLDGPLTRSNVVFAGIHPTITVTLSDTTINCTVTPAVGRDQRLALLLSPTGAGMGYALDAPRHNGAAAGAASVGAVAFDATAVAAGTYVVRLEVDGLTSIPEVTGGTIVGPTVVIP